MSCVSLCVPRNVFWKHFYTCHVRYVTLNYNIDNIFLLQKVTNKSVVFICTLTATSESWNRFSVHWVCASRDYVRRCIMSWYTSEPLVRYGSKGQSQLIHLARVMFAHCIVPISLLCTLFVIYHSGHGILAWFIGLFLQHSLFSKYTMSSVVSEYSIITFVHFK